MNSKDDMPNGLSLPPAGSFPGHIRWIIRRFVASRPALYRQIKNVQGKYGLVDQETEIVIEGYPRCANSFAEAAFRVAQERKVKVAHHTHAPAQVIAGVQWNIPVVILFRDPDDAVISRVLRSKKTRLKDAYSEYIWFYETIWPVLGQCVISNFETTTQEMGTVIQAVNRKFGTEFKEFDPSDPSMLDETKALIDRLSLRRTGRPTNYSDGHSRQYHSERKKRKEALKERMGEVPLRGVRVKAKRISDKLYARIPSK